MADLGSKTLLPRVETTWRFPEIGGNPWFIMADNDESWLIMVSIIWLMMVIEWGFHGHSGTPIAGW